MAWQVIEQAKDAVISVSREADMSTCVRTFLVYEDNPAYTLPANGTFEIYLQIRNATVAPFNVIQKVGTRLVPGATDFLRAQFVVSDLQISPHPDRANTFVVKQTSKAPLIAGQAYRGVKVTEDPQPDGAGVHAARVIPDVRRRESLGYERIHRRGGLQHQR